MKNKIIQNVLKLLSGSIIAQLILILSSPILTRIYSPKDFGEYAILISSGAILSIIITGRYELAIIVPKSEKKGDYLLVTTLYIILSCSVLILIVLSMIYILNNWFSIFVFSPSNYFFFTLIIGYAFFYAIYQTINIWFSRKGKYTTIANLNILLSLGIVLLNLSFGMLNIKSGLIYSSVLIQGLVVLVQLITIFKTIRSTPYSFNIFCKILIKYINYPKFLIIAHLFNTISSQSPSLLIGYGFGQTLAGYFSLTQRTLRVPISIISSSIGNVFRIEAAKQFTIRNNAKEFYKKTFFVLLSISVPFLLLGIISIEKIFIIIFGEEWKISGEIAKILMFLYFLQFITTPLSNLFLIAKKQKQDLIWQICLLTLVLGSLSIGIFYENFFLCITMYTFSYIIMYIINLILTYKYSKGESENDYKNIK